jgi:hypothetical protein
VHEPCSHLLRLPSSVCPLDLSMFSTPSLTINRSLITFFRFFRPFTLTHETKLLLPILSDFIRYLTKTLCRLLPCTKWPPHLQSTSLAVLPTLSRMLTLADAKNHELERGGHKPVRETKRQLSSLAQVCSLQFWPACVRSFRRECSKLLGRCLCL